LYHLVSELKKKNYDTGSSHGMGDLWAGLKY
jgi:hypothetical protein